MYPDDLQQRAKEQLEHLGVLIRTGAHVTDVQPGYVMVGEERIDSVCTLWGAGVEASPLGKTLGAPLDKRGSVLVDEHLNPPGMPNVFVIGDLAHFEQDGQQVPGVAQPAMQMGDYAAKRIGQMIEGKVSPKGFHYFDKGDMATIGKSAAVANVKWPFKGHWSGFPAWVAWLTVHIFFLVGFRNRFSVFREWIWTYLRDQDSARLITGSQILPGWERTDLRDGMNEDGDLTTVPLTADQSESTLQARG
jgi:NADH dehydrogenase